MVEVLKINVLKVAMDRRADLLCELEKLDEFIRMAEALIRDQPNCAPMTAGSRPCAQPPPREPTLSQVDT